MLSALISFVAGDLIAPDAFTRLVNTLRGQKAEYRRLVKHVHLQSGVRPGRAYRRWISREGIWDGVVNHPQDSYTALVVAMREELAKRLTLPWRRIDVEKERLDAVALVDATLSSLIQSLDPARAVAVLEIRMRAEFQGVKDMLATQKTLAERLTKLPPSVATAIRKYGDTVDSDILARSLAIFDSADAITSVKALILNPPGWLSSSATTAWAWFAEFALAHRLPGVASAAFEQLALGGTDRSRSLCIAALTAGEAGDAARSQALLKQARQASDDSTYADITQDVLDGNLDSLAIRSRSNDADVSFVAAIAGAHVSTYGIDSAITYVRDAAARYPEYGGVHLLLAQLLLSQAQSAPYEGDRWASRQAAFASAMEARRLRRMWNGDSASAVEIACSVAFTMLNYATVLQLGRIAPAGEATEKEAASDPVRRLVTEAALALGDDDLASELLALVNNEYDRNILLGQLLILSDESKDAAIARLTRAIATARSDEDRIVAWAALASAGIDLPEREALESRNDEYSSTIIAQLEAARGNVELAIGQLRPWRNRSPRAAAQLATIYARENRTDAAVEVFTTSASTFGEPRFLVSAAQLLASRDRVDEAEEIALSAISAVRDQGALATVLYEILVDAAQRRGSWTLMASRARECIDAVGPTPDRRWWVVGALFNARRFSAAWLELERHPPLQADSESRARVWIDLHRRFAPGPRLARHMLDLIRYGGYSSEFAASTIGAFLTTPNLELSEDLGIPWRQEIERFTNEHPNHPSLRTIRVPDDPQGIIEALRPHLEGQRERAEEAATQVADGRLPYGMLAAIAGRSYPETLALTGAGCFPIVPDDRDVQAAELDAARRALGRTISADLSAINIAYVIQDFWPIALGAFHQVSTPSLAREDLVLTLDRHSTSPPTGTLGWNSNAGVPQVSDADPEEHGRVRSRLSWMLASYDALNVRDWPRLQHPRLIEAIGVEQTPVWMTALDMAATTGIPLYADDIVLRALARSVEAPAFGTYALLHALTETGAITNLRLNDLLGTLVSNYCVDLPFDAELLARVAGNNSWEPGGASFVFTRRATWRAGSAPYDAWQQITTAAASRAVELVPAWVYCAIKGISKTFTGAPLTTLVGGVLGKAVVTTGFRPSIFHEVVQAARSALPTSSDLDPLIELVKTLQGVFSEEQDLAVISRIILQAAADLPEADRTLVRQMIFVPESTRRSRRTE